MPRDSIELDPRVIIALDVYKPARREEILDELLEQLDDPINRRPVTGIPGWAGHYVFDTPGGIRVIYRTDEQGRVNELVDYFRPWRWAFAPEKPATQATPSE
jgi:hypothetical protein